MQHVGLGKTVNNRNDLEKKLSDLERELKRVEADDSWRNVSRPSSVPSSISMLMLFFRIADQTPAQAQGEAMIKKLKVSECSSLLSVSKLSLTPHCHPVGRSRSNPLLDPRLRRPAARSGPRLESDVVPELRHDMVRSYGRPRSAVPEGDDYVSFSQFPAFRPEETTWLTSSLQTSSPRRCSYEVPDASRVHARGYCRLSRFPHVVSFTFPRYRL
jgi:hypothetical protein